MEEHTAKRTLTALGTTLAIVAGISCATKTELSDIWKSDSTWGLPMSRILVIGVAKRDVDRRLFEDAFSTALEEQGVDAVPSYHIHPDSKKLSKPSVRQLLREHGFQGVVVTRLIQIDERKEYVPPKTYVHPNYYGRGLYRYYARSYDVVHRPGYTIETTVVRLETHLYGAPSAVLRWAAHSDTLNPKSVDDGIGSVTEKLSERLAADGFIPGI